jgi:IclR family acetate operon transcriptional repressor
MTKAPVNAIQDAAVQGKVRAVERALRLLERLAGASGGMRLGELAKAERLSAATCLRLLTTMQERGFVRFDGASGGWMVGAAALHVGANVGATRKIMSIADPVARQLSAARGLPVNIGILEGRSVTFLYRATPNGAATTAPPQQPLPVNCSAIGKAILSGLPLPEVGTLLGGGRLARLTGKSLGERTSLLADIREVQRARYALDDEENTQGLRCVAVPIFNHYHRPVAAISIASTAGRLRSDDIVPCGRELITAADHIMLGIGGARP